MKVIEIRDEAQLHQLRSAWESLLRESASDTIFLSWEWITAWWSSYGKPGELRVLLASDDDGVLRGIAPLRSQVVHKYGQRFPALCFIGDGSYDSDYLDFIMAPGYEQELGESFRAHWREEFEDGTILRLNEIPEVSPNLPFLRKLGEAQDVLWRETEVPCATVHLPQSWEGYLGSLQPRFRTKIRSVLRTLEGRPEVRFGFCENQEQMPLMLSALFELHTRRWAKNAKAGVFGWERKRTFYHALSALLLERGWLRCSWLEWNGQVVACQYGFAYGGKYFQLQEGYEPASEHWNVGIGLRAWSIREFLKQGLREYDFLGGVGRHKSDWGATTKHSKQIVLAAETRKNVLLHRAPEWEALARRSIKKLLPEKILAARQARLEGQRSAARHGKQNGDLVTRPGREWLRKAAANCYFHSWLPVLTRPLREGYQISTTHPGNWSNVCWNRRTEASARIFCYHRVNDENDPFFPAVSTKMFEQQMRFVARHHQVVSLSELLQRLETGRPGTLLAITFDDGYRDNYENAFPILQQYGVPATIFLTTGSIDSRRPLWFEQVSHGVKNTTREFIDLEIDIPRRFWLRTLAERLDCNSRIFGLLRVLPDSERQQWVCHILRQLAVAADQERRDQMLTWEQVRLMKDRRIDFGGHTVTHPFLSKIKPEQAAWEVAECKRRIEEELQLPVDYFAYPNGRKEDIGNDSKALIRSTGYRAALTTMWGINYRATDPMELRRSGPWEKDPALFASKLDWYDFVNG